MIFMNLWAPSRHSGICGVAQKKLLSDRNFPQWKAANLPVVSVLVRGKEEKLRLAPFFPFHFPLPFILLTLLSACLLSIFSFCLRTSPASLLCPFPLYLFLALSLLVQGDESGCVRVWKSTPQALYSQPHERFMMFTGVCVSVYVCVWGGDWKKGTRRDRGKKGTRVGG